MTKDELFAEIKRKRSFLCIGLDPDPARIPSHLRREKDPVFEFNRRIIDATGDLCVAYKPNIAFYECMGPRGWESLERTLNHIPAGHFTIADAKRGDIGNTSRMYARTFFDRESSGLDFDAVTVAPYMGADSVRPFLDFEGKWTILLALTSNEGSRDFQHLDTGDGALYEQVISRSAQWAGPDRLMFVVGATHGGAFAEIRRQAPEHFFLVPGVGAQGGDLRTVAKNGMNSQCGLLVNSSRAILYASGEEDFAVRAREETKKLQQEMEDLLEKI